MKNHYFILLILILGSYNVFSQTEVSTESRAISFDGKIIIEKNSGDTVDLKVLKHAIIDYPLISIEPQVDKFGNIYAYVFDTTRVSINPKERNVNRIKSGKTFPAFSFSSLKDETFDSDELEGYFLIFYFQISFEKFYFMDKPFEIYEEFVSSIPNDIKFKSFIITGEEKDKVYQFRDVSSCFSEIIPNGRNWNFKFGVNSSPTYILVDNSGKVVSYYDDRNFEQLKEDFYKLQNNH